MPYATYAVKRRKRHKMTQLQIFGTSAMKHVPTPERGWCRYKKYWIPD